MRSMVSFVVAYLRELYSNGVPFFVSMFGAILFVVADNLETPTGKVISVFAGGWFLIHAIETASIRAEAKAKTAFSANLINMLTDGRDVQITVSHDRTEADQ